ncbi:MAG: hypothetical protein Q7O66_14060 [Dehalococcoidia bacterium]|nr:hypothetical protein [Dehalococcoidia bacterium]
MTSVDEFQKKYPTIPREVIVKWEIMRNGVKDTEVLDKVSLWDNAGGSYVTYDFDLTEEQLQERRKQIKPGLVAILQGFKLKSGMGVGVRRHTKSPYEIKEVGDGQFALFEGEEKIEDIYYDVFPALSDLQTSKGTPVTSLVRRRSRRCFHVNPVRHCEYFDTGDQCRFCNFHSAQDGVRSLGVFRPATINFDESVEALKILGAEVKLIEGRVQMGGFNRTEIEAKMYFNMMEKLGSALPYKVHLTVRPQPMDRKDMQRLKDVGVRAFTSQMEIWDRRLFAEVCPGKAKHRGYDYTLEAYQAAVDVFGAGNVGTNLVAGVGMLAHDGFSTWQEARDSHIEGNNWLIEHGVVPFFTALRINAGSIYGDDPANLEKYPPTELLLEIALAHHEAMKKVGRYQKMDKFMQCPMDCMDVAYGGEIGILETAGDFGNWLSDVLRPEDNWLAGFIASAKQPAYKQ